MIENHVSQLMDTSYRYPEHATWLNADQISKKCNIQSLGGLELSQGCKVLHVPSYLQGLWCACQDISPHISWSQKIISNHHDWKDILKDFDAVLFAAGSGLFHDQILEEATAQKFPAQLVRGQSIQMSLKPELSNLSSSYPSEAVLCGKYITPLVEDNRMLIGATHEFKKDRLDHKHVIEELRKRSYNLSPILWDNGEVEEITEGYRVQSNRGKHGRLPIIGQSPSNLHNNSWIFTGLSSRGLIYHGIFGDILSEAILSRNEDYIFSKYPNLSWWKNR
mmetsp:Transcript_19356/g.27218  ORF Transcript_19356/g.27218 Transcript_19356/m.27218 type:complete len:278 (+) Transcript_19356:1-834(+)